MIEETVIQTIKERADLLSIVGEVVHLKRAGSAYKGLCPFHGEKTPSFTVNPQQNTYHCFGCHAHGDALRFIMDMQKLSFIEAVRTLADKVGVEIPETRRLSRAQKVQRKQKKELSARLFDVQEQLTQWYEQSLARSKQAKHYLQQRGISKKAAEAFRLGWASNDVAYFVQWVEKQQINLKDLQKLGVVIAAEDHQHKGDARLQGGRLRFRNRIMCPVFDMQDRVVGYSGRVIDPQQKIAKYLNSPETPIFTKGNHLYGLKTAKVAARHPDTPYMIFCEGNLDVIALWQAGLPYAVAAMGTAITTQQATLLKRLSKNVLCMMDGDQAGQKAAFKSLPILLEQGLSVRGRLLPEGYDPDSFIKQHGVQSLRQWIQSAQPLLLVQLQHLAQMHPRDPIGNAEVLKAILPLVRLIQDEQQKPLFLDEIAQTLSISRHQLTEMMIQSTQQKTSKKFHQRTRHSTKTHATSNHTTQTPSTAHNAGEPPTGEHSTSYHEHHTHDMGPDPTELDGHDLSDADMPSFLHEAEPSETRSQWVESPWWTLDNNSIRKHQKKPWQKNNQGHIQIKLRPALQAPKPLALPNHYQPRIAGYERELISTLYHIPTLLAPFIEREAHLLFSHSLLGDFVLQLQQDLVQTGYASGTTFLQNCEDQNLVTEIQDSLSLNLGVGSEVNVQRLLNDLINRLKKGRLAKDLTLVCQKLAQTDANDSEQRSLLLNEYQQLQTQIKALHTKEHAHVS